MSEIATQQTSAGVIAEIRGEAFRSQLAAALPEGITPERFQRIAITALLDDQAKQRDPSKQLLACDRASLYQAIIKCAQDGLNPDGRDAALVKRGDKVAYQPMIGGLRKIAARYGWTIRSAAVRERDEFDFTDEPPSLYHKVFTGGERGELCFAYAVARHADGRREQCVMTRDQVLKRAESATTQQVWGAWPDEMWAKTPARDLFQELPLAEEVRSRMRDALEPSAAERLYGPSEISEGTPLALTSEPGAGVAAAGAPAPPPDDEPGPSPDVAGANEPPNAPEADEPAPAEADLSGRDSAASSSGEADINALAEAASRYVPPNGKYAAGGAHGPKTLAEILALGDDGERWVRWALGKIQEPPEYAAAVWSFARVHAIAAYQEALARREARA